MERNNSRHLRVHEIETITNWIKSQDYRPRWAEVRSIIINMFGIERTEQSLMKNLAFKTAMKARGAVGEKKQRQTKPTLKKFQNLEQENDHLKFEIAQLQLQIQALIEERLEIINFLKSRSIPEAMFRRPLPPINRNPSKTQRQ